MSETDATILSALADGVMQIRINRPERRNALDTASFTALGELFAAAEADPDCRVLRLEGAGGHFCAGRDLAAAGARDLSSVLAWDEAWTRIYRLLRSSSKPSVAVVEGYAVAGGFTLAMACDFVLADSGAKFGALEMRNGFPAAVNTPVLTKLVGPRLALEFLLFGDLIGARRLHEALLINRLVDGADALSEAADDFCARLAALDADAVAMTKELHKATLSMPLDDALTMGKHANALIKASGRLDEAAARHARRDRKS